MDASTFRKENSISANAVIKVVRNAGFKHYNYPAHIMVENSTATGICLIPDAENAVREKMPEYADVLFGCSLKQATGIQTSKPKRADNRTLGCRFTFRTTEEFKKRLFTAKKRYGFKTMQDFLVFALDQYLTKKELTTNNGIPLETANSGKDTENIAWIKENVNTNGNEA